MEGSGDEVKTNPFETTPLPETPSVFETTPSQETPSVFETNTAPAPQTITLSGSVSEFQPSNYGTTNAPGGRKMQWKQFFFGLVLPYAVVFLFTGIMFAVEEVGDPWEYDEKTLTANENGYFTHDFQQSDDILVDWCNGQSISPDASFRMSCIFEYSESLERDKVIVEERVRASNSSDYSYFEIGEYTPSNSTIWFQPTNSSIETIEISLEFFDSSKDFDFVFDILSIGFCFLPFIYIGAVIFAFVKQKQSLAYGLLSALGLWIALVSLFIASLVMFGF